MKRSALLVLALVAACGGQGDASSKVPEGKKTLTVFAASSLTKAVTELGKDYEAEHRDVDVVFSFAGSQALVAQLQQGAPADVLATADLATAESVADELDGAPQVFAHNQLALVTPEGNPAGVRSLPDLAQPRLKVVLAGSTVPVGKAADKALEKAGVQVTPVSREDSVAGVVAKVRLGEADAGIAYVTDLQGGEGIEGVPLDGTTTDLAIAPVKGKAGREFVDFVLSDEGQQTLRSFGFS